MFLEENNFLKYEEMEKLINFYSKNKNIILTIILIIIAIIFFKIVWITKKDFNIFIYFFITFFFIYWLIFNLNETEKIIINNFTLILISWIFIILFFQSNLWITNKDALIMIWWIIWFWYWYKKYERDKEIEIINDLKIKENIEELIIDWKCKRVLYEKWYIKDYLWNIIESQYQVKFHKYIWIFWDIKEINEYKIIEMKLIISELINYKWWEKYFIKQLELIKISFNYNIEFYKKNLKDKILEIWYFEIMLKEVNSLIKNNP